MGVIPTQDKNSIIQELRIPLSLEQQNNEELVEILKVLQAEKHKLKEQRDHLQADVQRFAFYYEKAQREHEVTKEKLVTSQADVTELAGLHDQILENLVSLDANMTHALRANAIMSWKTASRSYKMMCKSLIPKRCRPRIKCMSCKPQCIS